MFLEDEAANSKSDRTPGPLLVSVLGAPCSGKSTLCDTLSRRYNVEHFSLSSDLRSLISSSPSTDVARVKSLFTTAEVASFRQNLEAGTLGPVHLSPRYVQRRIFPAGNDPGSVRMLIDGFPRDVARWQVFKDLAEGVWKPSARGVVVVLEVDREVAKERYIRRGRAGDVFDVRFEEYRNLIWEIMEVMKRD